MTQRDGAISKLAELIHDVKIAMLTTVADDGTLHSRPMATQKTDFDGDLWFFTRASSAKAHELDREMHVNVSYSAPDGNRYISVSGTGQVLRDGAKAKELWNPIYKAWFPQGLEDPELALLRVHVHQAEYWDSPSGVMVQLAGFAKALATGRSYQPGPGEHERVRL